MITAAPEENTTSSPLIDVAALRELMAADTELSLVDVRWKLGKQNGRQDYLQGHIPGAVFADMERDLAAPAAPALGRHPLPEREVFQNAVRRWGVNPETTVVVYDNNGSLAAARAWWLLRAFGHTAVVILDGGLAAWQAAGLELERGESTAAAGTVVLDELDLGAVVDMDTVAGFSGHGILLDARAGERYRGEVEPLDPRAGHVPGALSLPTTENLTPAGTFLDPESLRARFAALGVVPGSEVAVYCGSGVTAAHQIAALAVAGLEAKLYPGSFSQWSNSAEREVAVGG